MRGMMVDVFLISTRNSSNVKNLDGDEKNAIRPNRAGGGRWGPAEAFRVSKSQQDLQKNV